MSVYAGDIPEQWAYCWIAPNLVAQINQAPGPVEGRLVFALNV